MNFFDSSQQQQHHQTSSQQHDPSFLHDKFGQFKTVVQTTIVDPVFGAEIRPYKYSTGMDLKKMPSRWDPLLSGGSGNRVTTAFGDTTPNVENRRPWNTTTFCCPCQDDCGAVCDCLLCWPCFISRTAGGHFRPQCCTDDIELGHPGYFAVARIPGHPIDDPPCADGCCVLGFHAFFLPFWIIPFCWPFLMCGERCYACPAAWTRRDFVKNENIDEHCCATKAKVVFCCPCATIQTHREQRSIGYDPGTTCCATNPAHVGSHVLKPVSSSAPDATNDGSGSFVTKIPVVGAVVGRIMH